MDENKSSISQAQSYQEIGEFWDTHAVTDYWEATQPVEFKVDISSEAQYIALEYSLADMINRIASKKGVSSETLVNLWIQEKIFAISSAIPAAT